MLHPDGSWARASAVGSKAPVVHQSGSQRLWDLLDEVREMWLREGSLPVYGASATVTRTAAFTCGEGSGGQPQSNLRRIWRPTRGSP